MVWDSVIDKYVLHPKEAARISILLKRAAKLKSEKAQRALLRRKGNGWTFVNTRGDYAHSTEKGIRITSI